MEKPQIPKLRIPQSKPYPKPSLSPEKKPSRPAVWDCGSTLYDSFERTSFQRQLDSAITATSARSMSMPHRTDFRVFPDISRADAAPTTPRSKLSRSFQKLLRSVFSHSKSKAEKEKEKETPRRFVLYEDDGVGFEKDRKEKGAALTTIAEAPEDKEAGVMSPVVVKKAGEVSPEIGAAVRKTMSERFTAVRKTGRISEKTKGVGEEFPPAFGEGDPIRSFFDGHSDWCVINYLQVARVSKLYSVSLKDVW